MELSDIQKTIIEVILVVILVLAGASSGGILSWQMFICIFTAGAIAFIIIMCCRCQKRMDKIDKTLAVGFCDIKRVQDIMSGDVKIITTPEIIDVEGKVEKEIIIATFDLSYDLKSFLDVGKANLERGIVYRYYLPRECESDFEELKENLRKKGTSEKALQRQTAKYVPSNVIPFNVVLYDPSIKKVGYIYSPQEETNLFIAFDEKSFRYVRNYFKYLERISKK